MIIKVTEDHIARAKPCYHTECPVALAMKEIGLRYPSVGYNYLKFWFGDRLDGLNGQSVVTPENVRDFMKSFDDGEVCMPFEFALEIPK